MKKVTVVIPTRDRLTKLYNCLNSVYKSSMFKDLEIIVIDDGSKKETKDKIKKDHKAKIRLIENKKSIGVGPNRTMGAKLAKTPYVLFVDDDNVVDKNTFRILYDGMEKNKKISIAMPLMYFKSDPKAIYFKGCKTSLKTSFIKIFTLSDIKRNMGKDIGINTAPNLFMVRRSQGSKVDWFDKYLKGVYTDLDFFLKIKKINPNAYIQIFPNSRCWHDTQISIRGYRDDTYKNLDRMYLLGKEQGNNYEKIF